MRPGLRFGGTILAAMAIGILLLTSCSSSTDSSTSTTSNKPTGSLTLAVSMEGGTYIDTYSKKLMPQGGSFQAFSAAMFDSLVELTPDGQPRPGLAERWEIAPDGKTHTFYLRKGVKFQNGDDLTAADAKFSLDSLITLGTSNYAATWKAAIDSVELKDDYTVAIHLKQPAFELLNGSETLEGELVVLPKKYIEEKGWDFFDQNPVGSGPWKLAGFVAGTRIELEAMGSHWRAVPKFQKVTFLAVPEEGTKIAMLKTGELDIAEVAPDSVPGLKAAGMRIYGHYGAAQLYAVPFYDVENGSKYAYGDVRVRKAMALAIDRNELATKLYGGYGQPSALFYAPTTAYFFDPNILKVDPYDPEQAKSLLSAAGYAKGFNTKSWDMGGGGVLSNATLAVVGYWQKIGMTVEIQPRDYPTVVKMFNPKHSPEIWNTVFVWSSSGGVLQFEKMSTAYHPTRGAFKNLVNPRLGELIDKVPTIKDPVEKKKTAQEAVTLAKNEYSTIGLLDVDNVFALGPKVGDFKGIKGLRGLAAALELITHAKQ
ncbi:MAG: ABC transporter substrate-binding protein [Dehalococcoidia bacterium]|nr:ABC transporter substrate-binding protein [Dehalococcoidia bacterium]